MGGSVLGRQDDWAAHDRLVELDRLITLLRSAAVSVYLSASEREAVEEALGSVRLRRAETLDSGS